MSNRAPIIFDVTIPREYNLRRFVNAAKIYRVDRDIFNLGMIEVVSPQGMKVKTYNMGRTVCDLIKNNLKRQ